MLKLSCICHPLELQPFRSVAQINQLFAGLLKGQRVNFFVLESYTRNRVKK